MADSVELTHFRPMDEEEYKVQHTEKEWQELIDKHVTPEIRFNNYDMYGYRIKLDVDFMQTPQPTEEPLEARNSVECKRSNMEESHRKSTQYFRTALPNSAQSDCREKTAFD